MWNLSFFFVFLLCEMFGIIWIVKSCKFKECNITLSWSWSRHFMRNQCFIHSSVATWLPWWFNIGVPINVYSYILAQVTMAIIIIYIFICLYSFINSELPLLLLKLFFFTLTIAQKFLKNKYLINTCPGHVYALFILCSLYFCPLFHASYYP